MKCNPSRKIFGVILFFLAVSTTPISSTYANEVSEQNTSNSVLNDMSQQADYVFKGSVLKVEYRKSEPSKSNPGGVPYTFVTYKVEQEYKNQFQKKEFTLKFLGGKMDEENILVASNTPLMDVGDTDILFVRNNTKSGCPLVGCEQGRFREISGLIFDNLGRSIVVTDEGAIEYGQSVALPEVRENHFSDSMTLISEEVELENEADSIQSLEDLGDNKGFRPDPAYFGEMVLQAVQKSHSSEELMNLPEVVTADPNKPFQDKILSPELASPPQPYIHGDDRDEPEPVFDEQDPSAFSTAALHAQSTQHRTRGKDISTPMDASLTNIQENKVDQRVLMAETTDSSVGVPRLFLGLVFLVILCALALWRKIANN